MSKVAHKALNTELQGAAQGQERPSGRGLDGGRAQRALLANLRHELRTPLNAIIGYSEMLLEDAEDQGHKKFISDLHKIHSAGSQLLVLVNDILDPAKTNSGQADLALEILAVKLRHELRTPLNAIIGYSEMLLEDAEDQDQEAFIPDLIKIHSAGERFLSLINDLVNVSTPETGVVEPYLESSEAWSMIQDVVSSIRPLQEGDGTVAAERGSLLVVDDNEMNRDLLARHIERQGHTVTVAANGRQALEIIKTHSFHLVLLDIMMPEMNGYQVLQHLKENDNWRDIPVIMISALDEMDSVVRCIEMGAEDYLPKPFNPILLRARISSCLEKKRLRDLEAEQKRRLIELNKALEVRNRFIRATFGRYLSDEIVNSILETPEGVKLGGEKRKVTIMMTDLRGFTVLSERLKPEQVVQMLNSYFEVMVDVVLQYNGTINEIIGDALLVIFGAPQEMSDRAQLAIACAIEMQNAMSKVNEKNRAQGLPELEMGIGLNETEVIVGNIGSSKRSKYAVVGSGVNMTSRIESYSVGGQILISESVYREAVEILRIDARRDVLPKGVETPLRIYEVGGIAGNYNLALERQDPAIVTLARRIPVHYTVLEGKSVGEKEIEGSIARLSKNCAEITLLRRVRPLTNLKMILGDVDEKLSTRHFYGKVIERPGTKGPGQMIRFTSVPPEVDAYFQAHLQYAVA
ncbi:MAG: response regulator [Deltaproteobacteria bacterium]|nr:response regulator [Deltaproteobacteria bacterium]